MTGKQNKTLPVQRQENAEILSPQQDEKDAKLLNMLDEALSREDEGILKVLDEVLSREDEAESAENADGEKL